MKMETELSFLLVTQWYYSICRSESTSPAWWLNVNPGSDVSSRLLPMFALPRLFFYTTSFTSTRKQKIKDLETLSPLD